ncbi:MAG: nuclear transport factor 2 family protein [Nocardioidaceae bacterium]|nr:nuclear transport factor 2 family protein [Nocardioidaceae bacterium]MCL2613365.1 nuclear transport factor 2 family protein [Nocardioidaceae bacterium]
MTVSPNVPPTVERWHGIVSARDVGGLTDILADDAVFHSPALHAPQEGKALTFAYLSAAFDVLGPTLSYQREWYADSSAVLEFTADLDGLVVQGVDIFEWNASGLITDFTVIVRPGRGLMKVIELMGARLGAR